MRWSTLLCLIAAVLPLGCQTSRSWNQGCPGIYSGVRYFADQARELPVDGKIFFLLDLPVSAVVDTIFLPATAFMEHRRPPSGFAPGCRWANER